MAPRKCATRSPTSRRMARARTCCAPLASVSRRGCEDTMREELLRASADPVEAAEETTLRPRRLDKFVGQPRLKEHLDILLGAAQKRGQAVDHLLFAGPPGTGK